MPLGQKGRLHTVGIGEVVISDDPEVTLITYSLGSCIGVAAWDPEAGLGGLIHCLLPSAKVADASEPLQTAKYVDTGVVQLLQEMFDRGARPESLSIKIAGAGHPLQGCSGFRIGERNYAVLRKVLMKNRLLIASEWTRGKDPVTLSLQVADGVTKVKLPEGTKEI